MEQLTVDTGVAVILSISWYDPEVNGRKGPGEIQIGAFKEAQREEIADILHYDDGYEYALNVGAQNFTRFEGKTLECQEGKYLLV